MSTHQIERLIQIAKGPNVHGKWARFCLEEGLTKDEVFHWRKKLGLPVRTHAREQADEIVMLREALRNVLDSATLEQARRVAEEALRGK